MRANKIQKLSRIAFLISVVTLSSIGVLADDYTSTFTNWISSGPAGGDIRALAVDPKDKDHLVVTTIDGQVYDSIDAGTSWRHLISVNNPSSPQVILDNVIIDSQDSMKIYVSGHKHKQPGGFYKTVDGGRTWKESPELHKQAVHALVQSNLDPNMLIAGTHDGIFISKNQGDTWEQLKGKTVPRTLDALAIDPRDVNTIYAGTWYRPYKTTDGGKTWRLIKKGMIDDSDVFAIDINSENPDHVIASACSGIYLSNDKGETWTQAKGIPSNSRRTRAILLNPGKPEYVYAGTTQGFWMSTNGGKNWKLTTKKSLEVNSIGVHPEQPNRVFLGTNNNGLMVSNDFGRTFSPQNGNFSSRFIYSITPDEQLKNRLYATTINTATGGGHIFVSSDLGRTWTDTSGNLDVGRVSASTLIQDRVNPMKLYIGTNSGIYKSLDRGRSWKRISPPKSKRRTRSSRRSKSKTAATATKGIIPALSGRINKIVHSDDATNGFIAATNSGLYMTDNVDKGWKMVALPVGVKNNVQTVYVQPNDSKSIWIGTATSGVLVSRDGGTTWSRTTAVRPGIPVSTIVTNPKDPNQVFVGTVQTVYKSSDAGRTWVRKGGGLPLGNYASIIINKDNPNDMFAGSALTSSGGIFHSTDAGETWKRIDSETDIASPRIWSLMFSPSNSNELLVATHSAGIYRITRTMELKQKPEENAAKVEKPAQVRTRISSLN